MKRLLIILGFVTLASIGLAGCSNAPLTEEELIYYTPYYYPSYTYGYYRYPNYAAYQGYPYPYDYWRRTTYYNPRYARRQVYRGGYHGGYHYYIVPQSYYGYRTYRYRVD